MCENGVGTFLILIVAVPLHVCNFEMVPPAKPTLPFRYCPNSWTCHLGLPPNPDWSPRSDPSRPWDRTDPYRWNFRGATVLD
jgi:hypothetical protein